MSSEAGNDYAQWAAYFGADDYQLPANADVRAGTEAAHAAMLDMLLEAAETAEEKELIRKLGSQPCPPR